MSEQIMQIANSWGLWIVALCLVSVVLLQAMLFTRLAFQSAEKIGYPRDNCVKGFRSGLISAIGPSIAVFIVMVGMMSVLGGPITWLRLSMIGSAPTELTAAKLSADALGVAFGSAEFDGIALANAYWAMSVNGIGWLLVVGIFARRMEAVRLKIGGSDPQWLAKIGVSASLGCFGYLNSGALYGSFVGISKGIAGSVGPIGAILGGMFGMIGMILLARQKTWLKEYTLGVAMLVGMGIAILVG